jgi:hypothetical protein
MTINTMTSILSGKFLIFGCLSLLANPWFAEAENATGLDDLFRKLEALEQAVNDFSDAEIKRQSTPPTPMPIPADGVGPVSGDQVSGSGKSEVEDEPFGELSELLESLENRVDRLQTRKEASFLESVPDSHSEDEENPLPMVDLGGSSTPVEWGPSDYPRVEELDGQVSLYDEKSGSFRPARPGFEITQPILFVVGADSELILSFPGQAASRVGGNSRVVVAPARKGRYEIDLQLGTISALLDPERNLVGAPVFAVRTMSGVVEAKGTFYAITEYKGQTYSAVKKGKIYKKESPPTMSDFASYVNKKKSVSKTGGAEQASSPSAKR